MPTTYLVTGASRGIGYATAQQLGQQPDTKVLALARDTAALTRLADSLPTDTLHYLPYDLTQPDPSALVAFVEAHGPLHGLLNNAGLLIHRPFAELTAEDWQQLFAVNVFGAAQLVQTLLPYFAPEGAHIVNIGSMGGYQGSSKFPGLAAYSAAKAALSTLSECLAEELKDQRIAVNCLALGAVQTEMLARAFPGYEAPLSSEEMGEWIAYFLREGHRFFNGKVLPVSINNP